MKLFYNLAKNTRFWTDNSFIFRQLKHLSKVAIVAIIFNLMSALFEGLTVGLLASFLRSLTDPNSQPIQTGIHWLDALLGVDLASRDHLYRTAGLIILIGWIRGCLNYGSSVFTGITQLRLVDRVRCEIFEQLQSFSLRFFSKTRSGDLINTITNETGSLNYFFGAYSALLSVGLTASVYVISLFWLSWPLTIGTLVLCYLASIGISALNIYVRNFSLETTKANGKFTSIVMEFISGIRTVHAFVFQDFERRRFYQASSDLVKANTQVTLASAILKPLSDGIAITILMGLIMVSISGSISNGPLEVGSLLTFLFVLFRLIPLLQTIAGITSQISSLGGSLEIIKQFLREDDKPYFLDGAREFSGLAHSIDFVGVDFGYDLERLILHNISLTIKKGETTALVGASGAGKTTLADLIARFIDPIHGRIMVGGVDLRDYRIASIRTKMAIVSQETFIFNTSVHNNIIYGSEGASREQAIEAAQLANALEFIQDMPDGFETILGDRGVRLSGGQRQRIAIARALLRNPEILILDEATSALDSVSERFIQESLEKLSVGRTVIVIAHRLSTIAQADKVVVLEQGRIVEQGRYQKLLEQRGMFWKYHQLQYNSNAANLQES